MTARLLGRHRAGDLVAFGSGGERTAGELLADAARVAAELPPASEGSQVLLVFKSDRYAFASALIGAWGAGHTVALPPNNSRDAVLGVLRLPDVVAMVHDTEAGRPIRIEPFGGRSKEAASRIEVTVPARAVVATLFTSGTQSVMTPCAKSETQLLSEAAVLVDLFDLGPGERLVATVQPSHIYGLLFSVLAPLVSGGAFIRETPFHAETIASKVQEHGARALVTVPAHLRGLATVDTRALGSLRRVFSSTAPLPADVAHQFYSTQKRPLTEILGSTETGGIAWRERPRMEAWQPLPRVEVEIDEDGFILVESPFAGGEGAFRTADLAKPLPDGSFLHLGRSDGIVKIAGQRVSLPAIEQWLCSQEGVEDAALVAVQNSGVRDVQLLAAVVAPEWTVLRVREVLSAQFEVSALPRRVVLVERLPREDNGKLPRRRLLELFGLNADAEPIRWDVDWGKPVESSEQGDHAWTVELHIPKTYGAFEGHFPTYPILAAAFQLDDLVLPFIRKVRSDLGNVLGVRRLKFLGRIVPDDHLELRIDWKDGEDSVNFVLSRAGKQCSGGRLLFAEGSP